MDDFLDNITRRFLSPKEQQDIANGIPRFIDGNLLLLNFAKRRNDQKGIYISLVEAEHLIRNAPTVEAEPVIRCRECRFFDNPLKIESGVCTLGRHIKGRKMSCSGFGTTINDYCSRAERKDNG